MSRLHGGVAGVVAAGVAVGSGELTAGLLGLTPLVVSVGEAVVALTPAAVARVAIALIGGLNRPLLVAGTLVLLGAAAAGIGVLALRRAALALAAAGGLAAVGVAASVADPTNAPAAAPLPGLVAFAAGLAALWLLHPRTARLGGRRAAPAPPSAPAADPARRRFLQTAGGLGALGVVTGLGGRWLQGRGPAGETAVLALPAADEGAPAVPAGADFDLDGLSSYMTPNDAFYRIDTAVRAPRVSADQWRLRVHGMVDQELTLDYADLLGRDLVEADVTLACVSNEVGGDLVGNARWLGVRLDEVLADAGVSPRATQLVGRSVDGYTGGFPVTDALDGRDALLAVGMNGEALPREHGYPVRLVVPGLYGYVSAVKWLAELELTTFEAFDHYWVRRGWAVQAPIKLSSRIDRPRHRAALQAGRYVVAGVAWAPTRGIRQVEVQVGDGDWQPAELGEVTGDDTWRQWRYAADLPPGRQRIRVRATDGTGATQSGQSVDPAPDGAEGWHSIEVRVG